MELRGIIETFRSNKIRLLSPCRVKEEEMEEEAMRFGAKWPHKTFRKALVVNFLRS